MRIGSSRLARHPGVLVPAGLLLSIGLVSAACAPWLRTTASSQGGDRAAVLSEQDRAIHLLNRATYGVRTQDVEEVLRVGIDGWLDRQLHAEQIDDEHLEARLARLSEGLSRSVRVVAPPRPAPPGRSAVPAAQPVAPLPLTTPLAVPERQPGVERQGDAWPEVALLRTRAAELRAQAARLEAEAAVLEGRAMQVQPRAEAPRAQKQAPVMRLAVVLPANRPGPEYLAAAKLERAVSSARQLEEVMTDFWFNHFNVFVNKDRIRLVLEDYERTAIRAHVFGRFEDMLVATAQHPAMLIYLDNYLSTAPSSGPQPQGGANRQPRGGVNENYARELLELHTVGIDGAYTQQDVVETARAFTGWTIQRNSPTAGRPAAARATNAGAASNLAFEFRLERHDGGEKVVLGQMLPAGRGIEDGLDVLRMLAHHPSTADHLARKLVRHFVAEDPPRALVTEIAGVFRKTGGDLRAVTRALFTASAFYDPTHFRAKVKRPFEFMTSALRVTGADVNQHRGLVQQLRSFGHLPYSEPAPTGYPIEQEEWVSAAAMLARMSFALDLAEGRVAGVRLASGEIPGGEPGLQFVANRPGRAVPRTSEPIDLDEVRPMIGSVLGRVLVGAPATELEAAMLEAFAASPPSSMREVLSGVLGFALGSPAFQKH